MILNIKNPVVRTAVLASLLAGCATPQAGRVYGNGVVAANDGLLALPRHVDEPAQGAIDIRLITENDINTPETLCAAAAAVAANPGASTNDVMIQTNSDGTKGFVSLIEKQGLYRGMITVTPSGGSYEVDVFLDGGRIMKSLTRVDTSGSVSHPATIDPSRLSSREAAEAFRRIEPVMRALNAVGDTYARMAFSSAEECRRDMLASAANAGGPRPIAG